MMHRAWSSIVEVPYCFSRSYVKFQGHMALKIVEFDPNWAFPDCNTSLNSPMAMKCCTKLERAKERCPIVFQGHPSNFKVTRYLTSPILTQIRRFRTIGRSQLSNPSDLPCSLKKCIWKCLEMVAILSQPQCANTLNQMVAIFKWHFYPRPVLAFGYCRCLRLSVCVSVRQPRACPHHNSSRVQARTTKFGQKMQNNFVKVPIVLGGDWPWPSRSN